MKALYAILILGFCAVGAVFYVLINQFKAIQTIQSEQSKITQKAIKPIIPKATGQ